MSVRKTARKQYQAIVDHAASAPMQKQQRPSEGWLATTRKALGMSAAQLARRMGLSRARISQAEATERAGGVTLKTLEAAATAMGCRFVYAIVPAEGKTVDIIADQARKKAETLVGRAGIHMALERQSLSSRMNAEEIDEIAGELMRELPSDLWEDR